MEEKVRKNLLTWCAERKKSWKGNPKEEEKQKALSLRQQGPFAPYGEPKQSKADNSPLVSVPIRDMPSGMVLDKRNVRLRSSSDKVARFLRRNGDNFSDYHDSDYSESPREPAWKAGQSKLATPRPDSPFKRSGKAVASVVIVRRSKP